MGRIPGLGCKEAPCKVLHHPELVVMVISSEHSEDLHQGPPFARQRVMPLGEPVVLSVAGQHSQATWTPLPLAQLQRPGIMGNRGMQDSESIL